MKKKLLTILLATFMVLTLVPATIFAEIAGEGTEANPWQIGTTGHESDVKAWVSSDKKTLNINGENDGVMMDFNANSVEEKPWYSEFNETITSVVIDSGVTTVGKAFMGSTAGKTVLPNVTSINLPSTITAIGECAFEYSKITSISIPEGITIIKPHTFSDCPSLASVTLPSTITEINSSAFANCTNLKKITLPSSLTKIDSTALTSSGITEIVVEATTPPTLDGSFTVKGKLEHIYVPGGALDAYLAAEGWKKHADIISCNPNQSASIEVTAIKEAQFSYTMVIPSNVPTITEAGIDRYIEVGSPFIKDVEGAKDTTVIKYTATGTDFVNTEDKTKTMTANYRMPKEWDYDYMYEVTVYEDNEYVKPYKIEEGVYGPLPIVVMITKDDWKNAPSGTYKSKLTFNFTTSEKTPG